MPERNDHRWRQLARAAVLFCAYVATARLGLAVDAVAGFATLVWAPTGLAIAALIVFGNSLWPAVALAAFVVNLLAGAAPLTAGGIAAGNTLEAWLAATALRRFGFDAQLARIRDVVGLVVLAGLACPLVSASVGVGSLWASGHVGGAEVVGTWGTWWAGDALGALIVAPLLLCWQAHAWVRPTRRDVLELLLLIATFTVGMVLVFPLADKNPFGRAYLLYPVLIWSALRFGPRGATLATFATSAIAIAATAHGIGPFTFGSLNQSLLAQQGFMGITAATILVLAAAAAERDRAVRLRDDFLAVAAHELRTPATALKLQVGNLQRRIVKPELATPEKLAEGIEKISTQVERFIFLIQRLLDVSRVNEGRLTLEAEQVDLSQLVREVAGRLGEHAGAEISLHPGLGDPCVGRWDRLRVEQVITNLLGNALKYGAGKPVEVTLRATDQEARLTIQDHGIGIAPEDQARIFERFERASPAKNFGGLGLGLWISHVLADAMGAKISVVSQIGAGATFTLTLPRADAA